MIEKYYIDAWREQAPWVQVRQVEQDLIISRALVELYNQEKVKNSLVFRGGTALNKLFIQPPARYSEDIDFVQKDAEPIGDTMTAIRNALDSWLGSPKRKLTKRSAKLIYRYQSSEGIPAKLKIEINTTEHFHLLKHIEVPFKVDSEWFSDNTMITTYQVDELMGTKLRALYQRRKGRDLFDMWLMLKNNMIDVHKVIEIFLAHGQRTGDAITRAMFEKSLFEKSAHKDFREEIADLVTANTKWDFDVAYQEVLAGIVAKIPGDPWVGNNSK
jgi:predicted nucleotidyltransferase component of viral defense system